MNDEATIVVDVDESLHPENEQCGSRTEGTGVGTRDRIRGDFICYILQSAPRPTNTYVGVTNNWARRVRQHNGGLVGGAKRTSAHRPWRRVAYVSGFADKNAAMRFEWSMHNPRKRRLTKPHKHVAGRLHCARQLLARDEWRSLRLHEE